MLGQFECQINHIFPADPLLQFTQLYSVLFPNIVAKDPLKDAMLICTDGSSNGKVAYVAYGEEYVVWKELAFTQTLELGVVVIAF